MTGRVWDYGEDEFVHRVDLLNCSDVFNAGWGGGHVVHHAATSAGGRTATSDDSNAQRRGGAGGDHPTTLRKEEEEADREHLRGGGRRPDDSWASDDDPALGKEGKKVTSVKITYEAMLHSALEEQANFYEKEIAAAESRIMSRVRDLEDRNDATKEEGRAIDELRREIGQLEVAAAALGSRIVDVQKEEVELKEVRTKLEAEQTKAAESCRRIREDAAREKKQLDDEVLDLETQFSELTTFLQVKQRIDAGEGGVAGGDVLFTAGGNAATGDKGKSGKKGGGKKKK